MVNHFKSSIVSVEDDDCCGCPSTSTTLQNIAKLLDWITARVSEFICDVLQQLKDDMRRNVTERIGFFIMTMHH